MCNSPSAKGWQAQPDGVAFASIISIILRRMSAAPPCSDPRFIKNLTIFYKYSIFLPFTFVFIFCFDLVFVFWAFVILCSCSCVLFSHACTLLGKQEMLGILQSSYTYVSKTQVGAGFLILPTHTTWKLQTEQNIQIFLHTLFWISSRSRIFKASYRHFWEIPVGAGFSKFPTHTFRRSKSGQDLQSFLHTLF